MICYAIMGLRAGMGLASTSGTAAASLCVLFFLAEHGLLRWGAVGAAMCLLFFVGM